MPTAAGTVTVHVDTTAHRLRRHQGPGRPGAPDVLSETFGVPAVPHEPRYPEGTWVYWDCPSHAGTLLVTPDIARPGRRVPTPAPASPRRRPVGGSVQQQDLDPVADTLLLESALQPQLAHRPDVERARVGDRLDQIQCRGRMWWSTAGAHLTSVVAWAPSGRLGAVRAGPVVGAAVRTWTGGGSRRASWGRTCRCSAVAGCRCRGVRRPGSRGWRGACSSGCCCC